MTGAKLLIIYHSQSGNTESMAKAVYEGAVSSGADVNLKKAADTTSDDILNCDAIIIGTPNYFGYMAGMMKDLLDRVWYIIRGRMEDKPYALFTSSGGGNRTALEVLGRLCEYLKMKRVSDDVVAKSQPSFDVLDECKRMGRELAEY